MIPLISSVGELKMEPDKRWTEVERVILQRRSTRMYRKTPVPEESIRRILEAGRFAPSAGNCQPWRFIVINSRMMIDEMESILFGMMSRMKGIVNAEGWKRDLFVSMTALFAPSGLGDLRPFGAVREVLAGRLKIFHDAPCVILVLKDTRGIDSPEFDTGICSQNIVLAAHSLGLGTCYIGFASLLKRNRNWMKKMKIQPPWAISTAICVGTPKFKSDGLCQRDMPQIDYYDESGRLRILY